MGNLASLVFRDRFGFSPLGAAEPWLPQPDWFDGYAVSDQAGDLSSMLSLYRRPCGPAV